MTAAQSELVSTEEWREVPGTQYMVSSEGRFAKVLQGGVSGRYVAMTGIRRLLHHVMAEVFIGPRPPGMVIRHLDGNPHNNAVSNLAYGTQAENVQDAVTAGKHYSAILSAKTHCIYGHEFVPENTYTYGKLRRCRACNNARQREYRKKWKVSV